MPHTFSAQQEHRFGKQREQHSKTMKGVTNASSWEISR
jgi:hypothetical protein